MLAISGVIIRPFRLPEAVWAVAGAVLLLLFGLISPAAALTGVAKGTDVYLFLIGMMLLAETAREAGLFDFLAVKAAGMSGGSGRGLFLLIYLVGVLVTVFLSNDATAVVLTPAVAAAMRAAKVEKPLPYLLICAFIANAASFVLPISNPANLVIYGSHLPPLADWLKLYALPSLVSIAATYFLLYRLQKKHLPARIAQDIAPVSLSREGRMAGTGIIVTGIVLLVASARGMELGLPTFITGIIASAVVLITGRNNPVPLLKGISWLVLPLVAGLFVIVEAINTTGVTDVLTAALQHASTQSADKAVWLGGIVPAFACNLMNNLPAGLIAGTVVQGGQVPAAVKSAVLVGIDLGPNLSVTGSLATILWLTALRRENQVCTSWQFLKTGIWVMTIPLLLTLAVLAIAA